MPENIIPITVPWVLLLIAVIGLAFYKKSLDSHVDEHLHFGVGDEKEVTQQVAEAKKSGAVETWGKILTTVVFLYGLAIVGLIVYHQWQVNATVGFK